MAHTYDGGTPQVGGGSKKYDENYDKIFNQEKDSGRDGNDAGNAKQPRG